MPRPFASDRHRRRRLVAARRNGSSAFPPCGWDRRSRRFHSTAVDAGSLSGLRRRRFRPRQIERTIVELDHVTLADQPVQVGRQRQFCAFELGRLSARGRNLFGKLFAIDARDCRHFFENRVDGSGNTRALVTENPRCEWAKRRASRADAEKYSDRPGASRPINSCIIFEGDRISADQASSITRPRARSGSRRLSTPSIVSSCALRNKPGR